MKFKVLLRQSAKAKEQQIFSFEEDQVQSFTVKTKEQTLEFDVDQSGQSKWLMGS